VPAGGGAPKQIGAAVNTATCPLWTPDGNQILFVAGTANGGFDWWLATVSDERPPVATGLNKLMLDRGLPAVHANMCPGDWIGNRVVFTVKKEGIGSLWQVPISLPAGRVAGELKPLLPGPGLDYPRLSGEPSPRIMVFGSGGMINHLWSVPIDTKDGRGTGQLNRLTQDASLIVGLDGTVPSLSREGRLLTFASGRSGTLDIWVRDLASGKEYPVAANPWREDSPVLSPDGRSVAYCRVEGNRQDILITDLQTAVTKQLCTECGPPQHWSSATNSILYLTSDYALWSMSPVTGERRRLLGGPGFWVINSSQSPDGRWLAFVVKRKGINGQKGYVARLGEDLSREDAWIAVAEDPFTLAMSWAAEHPLLYYFGFSGKDSFRCLWAQPLNPKSYRPTGDPFAVHHFHKVQQYPLGGSAVAVSRDKLVVNLTDTYSNIWMAELP
jgi:Tol biopolymer transport system component